MIKLAITVVVLSLLVAAYIRSTVPTVREGIIALQREPMERVAIMVLRYGKEDERFPKQLRDAVAFDPDCKFVGPAESITIAKPIPVRCFKDSKVGQGCRWQQHCCNG